MTAFGWLTTREIKEVFAHEVEAARGRVTDALDDGARIFLRAVLAGEKEVQRRDRVQGGVAVRATSEDICVHPYVFRQVCSNGAIRAHAIETRKILRVDSSIEEQTDVEWALREAVRVCCSDEAFAQGVAEMRSARNASEIDLALMMMPALASMARGASSSAFINTILNRFFADRERSRFGLMNAVTSVARDTKDPEIRWRLEEFGGDIAAAVHKPTPRPVLARAKVAARAKITANV